MRILLAIEPSGGGSGRHVIDLAEELIGRGHRVTLIYSPSRAEPAFEAEAAALPLQALERLPMRRAIGPWDVAALLKLRRLIRRLGPFDVIHGHSAKAGALVRLATPMKAARVYTPHALPSLDRDDPVRLGHGLIELFLAHAASEAVIVVSAEEAEHARRWRFPSKRLHAIPNGLRPRALPCREDARAALDAAPDQIVVGFVGRLTPQKDPVRFARAVRLAALRDPRIVGRVIGEGELTDAVAEAGGEALRLLGRRDGRALLPGLDLLVVTSRYEAMPYLLLETAEAGVPFLATDVGGVSSVLDGGACGRKLSLDASPEDIAQAVLSWLKSSQPAAPGFPDHLRIDRMVDETLSVYRRAYALRRALAP